MRKKCMHFLMALLILFAFLIPVMAGEKPLHDGTYVISDAESGYASDSLFTDGTDWENMIIDDFRELCRIFF